jgi:hypothetical protein
MNKLVATDFQNANGWSKRQIGPTTKGGQFTVRFDDHAAINVTQGDINNSPFDVGVIDLEIAGHPPQSIWRSHVEPRRVCKNDYMQVFEKP